MTEEQPDSNELTRPQLFGLSASVYAQRDGKILILKRAGGEVTGGWYIPGGGHEHGEDLEKTAIRELQEESGLVPDGPLTLIGLVPMRVYGGDAVQASYAADCTTGEVVISDEHSAARWIEPSEYRERYFGDDTIDAVAEKSERVGALIRAVRDDLDRYIEWAAQQAEYKRLQELHTT
jgi:8-oxo-dGTP pyrophosphatase MutT (NUDIX family)